MELEAIEFDFPKGFYYIKNFISKEEELDLLEHIDTSLWENTNRNKIHSRLVQHYGCYYDYGRTNKHKRLAVPEYMNGYIEDINEICEQLCINSPKFNQVSVHNYNPGERRHKYVNPLVYNDIIVYLSLVSSSVVRFRRSGSGEKVDVNIESGSLYITSSSCTYSWAYEMLPSDDRRVCVTLRELE